MGISKIRCGFVTNSSSSSFVLSFKNKRMAMRFIEDCEHIPSEAKPMLIHQFKSAKKMTQKQMRDYLTDELTQEVTFKKIMRSPSFDFNIRLDEKDEEKINHQVEELMKQQEDNWFNIIIEQDDDTELGSQLEHEILPNLKPVLASFSHH